MADFTLTLHRHFAAEDHEAAALHARQWRAAIGERFGSVFAFELFDDEAGEAVPIDDDAT